MSRVRPTPEKRRPAGLAVLRTAALCAGALFAGSLTCVLGGAEDAKQPARDGEAAKPQEPPVMGPEAPKTTPKKGAPPQDDAKAVEVIDRYIAAIGGRETLAKLQDRTLHFTNKKFSPTGVTEVKMSRFIKGTSMVREEWEMPGMGLTKPGEPLRFLQVYDGKVGWVQAMGCVSPLEGKTLQSLVWDKYVDDFFVHWKEDGYVAKYRGEALVEDVPCHKLELDTIAGSAKSIYLFGKENGLLLKKEWRHTGPEGNVFKENYFHQYTKIRLMSDPEASVLVSIKEQSYTDGELDLEREYTEVRLNSGISDALFERPAGQDFEEFEKEKAKRRAQGGATTGSGPASQPASQPASPPASGSESKPESKPASQPASQPAMPPKQG